MNPHTGRRCNPWTVCRSYISEKNSSSYLPQAARASALWICFCLHLSSFRLFYNHPRMETCASLSSCFLLRSPLSLSSTTMAVSRRSPTSWCHSYSTNINLGCTFLLASIFILQTQTHIHLLFHPTSFDAKVHLSHRAAGVRGCCALIPALMCMY